jgi:hypothetical protein
MLDQVNNNCFAIVGNNNTPITAALVSNLYCRKH